MQVHELVARFAAAVETADPMGAARKVLEDLRGEINPIEKMLAYISGIGGNARQVFYRSPNLTMLKVCFPNGRRTVPIIWLAFYAIAVVGALAWPRHAAETPELATIYDGARDAAAHGKTVWK